MAEGTIAYYRGGFCPIEDATVNIRAKGLNYGLGCFEGIRAYWRPDEEQLYVPFGRSAVRLTEVTRAGRARVRTGDVLYSGSNSTIAARSSAAGSHTHELPWLQVPVPVDGQSEKSQTNPHSPQLNGSV